MSWLTDDLQFDEDLWYELTERMAASGFTMVVIDLGDAIRYESHPEIAVKGAWPTDKLRDELGRLRNLGLEPIPKLNFSTAHDAWLGGYSRQVSTPVYYQVCADLIAETSRLFDTPRYFHLGMDEETAEHQRTYAYAVMRQHDLWWNDLRFLVDHAVEAGCRPWVWSDHAWRHPAAFYRLMPKNVLQSNWYYETTFDGDESGRPREVTGTDRYLTYLDLDEQGYDQVPTASTWRDRWDCFQRTVEFCRNRLDSSRLLGFLQTSWMPTVPATRDIHLRTIEVVRRTIDALGLSR